MTTATVTPAGPLCPAWDNLSDPYWAACPHGSCWKIAADTLGPCYICGATGECAPDCPARCEGCGVSPNEPCLPDCQFAAWIEHEAARGELAGAPEEMGCYECGGFDGVTAPLRKVVALGPVTEARRDPTQTYRLECGHLAF